MQLDVDAATVEGHWWRHVPAGADPARRPEPAGDNRWQHGAIVDALYLADSPDCVWAEWYRHLAEAGLPPLVTLPRDLWHYQVTSLRVADLSDPARLARVRLVRTTTGTPQLVPLPGRRRGAAPPRLAWPAHL